MTALRTRYALLPLLGLALAGCGGGSTSSTPAAAPTAAPTGAPRAAGTRVPGTSGLVAAVSGSTAQVQSTDSQTAVSWTGTTTFTDTVAGTAGDVTVGSCVVVRSTAAAASPAPTPAGPGPVAATAVTVSAPVDGSCAAGFPGGPGAGGQGGRPSGAPDPSASPGRRGARGGFGGAFGGAFGTVTAVTAGGFTVESTRPAGAPTPSAAPTAVTVTVTTGPATTYTRTVPATAASVQVGLCLTATGQPDSTGAVTATRIALRPAVDGACTTGRPGGAGA